MFKRRLKKSESRQVVSRSEGPSELSGGGKRTGKKNLCPARETPGLKTPKGQGKKRKRQQGGENIQKKSGGGGRDFLITHGKPAVSEEKKNVHRRTCTTQRRKNRKKKKTPKKGEQETELGNESSWKRRPRGSPGDVEKKGEQPRDKGGHARHCCR